MTKPATDTARRQRLGLFLLFGLTVLAALRRFLPQVLRADLYEADLCQHVWWMYRFADPTLFPNDPSATFMSRPMVAPYGYQALHRLFGPVLDAQLLADALLLGYSYRWCWGLFVSDVAWPMALSLTAWWERSTW